MNGFLLCLSWPFVRIYKPLVICSCSFSTVRFWFIMAQRKLGPFLLERQIGVGGMGVVYSAIYPENGKKVAVKVLSPAFMSDAKVVKRFEREIGILKRLSHPNIVKYYGGGTENGQRYYAMEFIDGGSLQQVIKNRGQLTWEQAIHVGRQVTSALEHAHNAGIIHRDLKPANLFLSRKGRLKLGDFGIARDTEATALTAAGKTVGTYAYMAPEQIQAGDPITGKTDLYALGCVLYEVIVGEPPFQSDNPMDMLMQHLQDDPYNVCEKVPNCPIELGRLIDRLLEKKPEDRPYDALAVHTELGEIRDKADAGIGAALSATSAADSVTSKATKAKSLIGSKKKKKKKKKKGPVFEQTWFLAACLLALIGATAWMLRPHGEEWYAAKWRDAMQGDEYAQRDTLEKHIDPYIEKFPEGKHIDEARERSAELHANMLEPQLKNLARIDKPIEEPFKAACVEAARLEDEEGLLYVPTWETPPTTPLPSNPLPAMQRWHKLINQGQKISNPTDEVRWLLVVCRNHHEYFRRKLMAAPDARAMFYERMQKAEERFAEGDADKQEAMAIWSYCYDEFKKIDRFADFAEYARQRSLRQQIEIPPADEAASVTSQGTVQTDSGDGP